MGLLNDQQITELAKQGMIENFVDHHVRRVRVGGTPVPLEDEEAGYRCISFGLSSYGYDIRLRNEYKIFTNARGATIDPKNFDRDAFIDHIGETCIVPPNSFVLGGSVERFKMPSDMISVCLGKSTYARCGIVVNVTPLEPGWEGHVTIEISNTTPLPAIVYSWEGICQALFFKGDLAPDVTYSDRGGKYHLQPGIVLPKV